jgi:calcineurin-like phosphoesterase
MPEKFMIAKEFPQFQAVALEIDPANGKALSIERINLVDRPA